MGTHDDTPDRQQLLTAVHHLVALCTADDLAADDVARLKKVADLLSKAQRVSMARARASADVTLVEELERIYQRVLDEAGGKSFVFSVDTFSRVRDAALAWASATGNHHHDAVTQSRLEELELDANEIEERGGLRMAKGTAKHAAIVMAEHVFEIAERTSYDRKRKNVAASSDDHDPQVDVGPSQAERATAFALESTTGLSTEEALAHAKTLQATARTSRLRLGPGA